MEQLDRREWLLTNGLGSFASGTVSDARTRTYHGWLMAALDPPSQRTLLLSHLDATLEIAGQVWALGTNLWGDGAIAPLGFKLLRSFDINPVPTWVWSSDDWQLTRRLVMPNSLTGEKGEPTTPLCTRILVQYRYEGDFVATLSLRLLIAERNFHHQQQADEKLNFSQLLGSQQICLQAIRPGWMGTPWHLRWSAGNYQPSAVWYWNYYYPEEHLRGLGDREDLYSPGYLTLTLQPGDALTLEARVGSPLPEQPLGSLDFEQAVQAEEQRHRQVFARAAVPPAATGEMASTWRCLLRASDRFLVYRSSIAGVSAIAGYPWFNDWGRDTLIALPGLTLTTGRFSVARGLLETFGRYCRYGLIPNTFPDAGAEPLYNSIDAALWWIEILGLYLEATQDWAFLAQQYPVVRQIYEAFCAGTLYDIHVDATDGLLSWEAPGVAITWMDAVIDGQPVTPRCGKPVEINALWYSALCWAARWCEQLEMEAVANAESLRNERSRYSQEAKQVKDSLQKFWNPLQGYFYDTISPDNQPDPKIRPNAVLALSLYHCGFPAHQGREVLRVAQSRLLTPYGLRSLDPADVDYVGKYAGDSEALPPRADRYHRDRAYHQGTVWSWLIGPFIRAWKRCYESESVPFNWQPLLDHLHQQACLGSISEIFDGETPHAPQGAFAQAWSVAELIRQLMAQAGIEPATEGL